MTKQPSNRPNHPEVIHTQMPRPVGLKSHSRGQNSARCTFWSGPGTGMNAGHLSSLASPYSSVSSQFAPCIATSGAGNRKPFRGIRLQATLFFWVLRRKRRGSSLTRADYQCWYVYDLKNSTTRMLKQFNITSHNSHAKKDINAMKLSQPPQTVLARPPGLVPAQQSPRLD